MFPLSIADSSWKASVFAIHLECLTSSRSRSVWLPMRDAMQDSIGMQTTAQLLDKLQFPILQVLQQLFHLVFVGHAIHERIVLLP